MATLKEFEDVLRERGMTNAIAILDELKKRDREKRSIAPARRVVGRKMTADLARSILDMHAGTAMTQQEIAFKLGVNQGRVNEVIKRGKWLNTSPSASEVVSRDKAMQRLDQRARSRRASPVIVAKAEALVVRREVAVVKRAVALPKSEPVRRLALESARKPEPIGLLKPRIISAQLAFLDL